MGEKRMGRAFFIWCALLIVSLVLIGQRAYALAPETEMLLKLLQAKGVITADDAEQFKKELAAKTDEKAEGEAPEHYHGIKGLSERVQKLEESREEVAEGAAGKIQFSGHVQAEAAYYKVDRENHEENEEGSDVYLAEAELDVDAVVNQYVSGHIAFLWKDEGFEEPRVKIDEGYVSFNGGDKLPLYCNIGKMVIPFGRYESHFVTDPTTLTLGETNEGALLVGYRNELLDLSAGFFNSDVDEVGHEGRDNLDNYFASAVIHLEAKSTTLEAGASYSSNLAASKTLRRLTESKQVRDYIGGYSFFATLTLLDRYNIIGEYLSATGDFALDDDLDFIAPGKRKPRAWNVEAAVKLRENLEAALRYGGNDEFLDELLEEMYGAALLYNIFDSTFLNLEYMQGKGRSYDDVRWATLQVAVEF